MLSKIIKSFGSIFTKLQRWVARPAESIPKITYLICAINAALYFWGFKHSIALQEFWSHPWDLVCATFSHVNFQHLIGNSFMLLLVGPTLEKALGGWKFLWLYLLCGIGAFLGFGLIFPDGAVLGASGAIMGCVAAYPFVTRSLTSILITGTVFGCVLYDDFLGFIKQVSLQGYIFFDPVAHLAHLSGALTGLITLLIFKRRSGVTSN